MDAFSIHGDHFYQGHPAQAPPPGTAPNQILPLGAVPPLPPAPAPTPLAPPGVSPSPSSTADSYYGTYANPPYGFLPSSADRWSSYPIPAAEPHPCASYPPSVPYDRPSYGGHHPYHQQDLFLHAHSFPSPPQACIPLPPRGSDVTRFRTKRPFLPHQNLRFKSKSFKQTQENFRGGGKNSQQVKRAFNSDPRAFNVANNGISVANNAQILHPFSQDRANEVPASCMGKKRRMDEREEGRPGRNGDRRKGDKRPRPGWNKGKRNKGRKQGGDKTSMDPNTEVKGTSPTVKAIDHISVTQEQAQEGAVSSEVHRDVRRRVQEFLRTLERESFQKFWMQGTREATLKGAGRDANAVMQRGTQEPTVGGEASAEIEGTQHGRQEAVGEVAIAETQDSLVEVGGDSNAEIQDTRAATDGDPHVEMQGIEEAVHADAQLGYVGAQQASAIDSSKAGLTNPLPSDCTEEQQLDHKNAVQTNSADLLISCSHIDAAQSEEHHSNKINTKKLDIVDILKIDCENGPRFATEIVRDLEAEDVQECLGVDEAKLDHKQKPFLEPANDSDQTRGKHPEAPTKEELKEREEKTFGFVTKLLEDPETPTKEELKEREEKTFGFVTKLLEENKDLRNMYIEKCNNGAFECLMCNIKIKKRFSNLVSLVTHASNVLKTKKLPEHRGYGRAVCALLGWDPQRYPKVPKILSHSGVENVPLDERAPLGGGDVCAPGGNAVEHSRGVDTMEDGLVVDAVKVVPVGNADESKLSCDADESALMCGADVGLHIAGAAEDEPVDDAEQMELMDEGDEGSPLGDADECAPSRDIGSSVEQKNAESNRLQRVDVEEGAQKSSPIKKRRGSSGAETSEKSSSEDNCSQLVQDVAEAALRFVPAGSKLHKHAVELATKCPGLKFYAERQPGLLVQTVQDLLPGVTRVDAVNIASFFLPKSGSQAAGGSWSSVAINDNALLQYNISHSYQSKGAKAKESPVDPTLPQNPASLRWKKADWDKVLSMGTSHENSMRALISAADWRGCFFELRVTGAIQTVDSLKPDVTLILKGHHLRSRKAIGALINLQSATSGCYDSDADVGKVITLAQVFLAKETDRKSIVVGVSDLQMIRFFRVQRAEEDSLFVSYSSGFNFFRDEPTSNIMEALSAYLQAHPTSLDVRATLNWQSLLPASWKLLDDLGHGRTSTVYRVSGDDSKVYAVKVAREGYTMNNDLKFLNELAGIDGIPRVDQTLSSSVLVLEPVGEPFTREKMCRYKAIFQVGDLVDILESAHKRSIVNRDIRSENIMIAKSSDNGSKRLFILDWGFATHVGTVESFSGSLSTASDCVLQQYLDEGKSKWKYTFADDLVSLVRCLFLFYNRQTASEIHKISGQPESILCFWKKVMESQHFWAEAQAIALKMNYAKLKTSLQLLQSVGD